MCWPVAHFAGATRQPTYYLYGMKKFCNDHPLLSFSLDLDPFPLLSAAKQGKHIVVWPLHIIRVRCDATWCDADMDDVNARN